MENPLYRDLINSIKNPFIGRTIDQLVQSKDASRQTPILDEFGGTITRTGGSLYFRIPNLPPTVEGHRTDPDGIPLPSGSFRVTSVDELRRILTEILEHKKAALGEQTWEAADTELPNSNYNARDLSGTYGGQPTRPTPVLEKETSPLSPPTESFDDFKARIQNDWNKDQEGEKRPAVPQSVHSQIRKLQESIRWLEQMQSVSGDLMPEHERYYSNLLKSKKKQLVELKQQQSEADHTSQWIEASVYKNELRNRERQKKVAEDKIAQQQEEVPSVEFDSDIPPPKVSPSILSRRDFVSGAREFLDEGAFIRRFNTREDIVKRYPRTSGRLASLHRAAEDKKSTVASDSVDAFEPATERVTLMDLLRGSGSSSSRESARIAANQRDKESEVDLSETLQGDQSKYETYQKEANRDISREAQNQRSDADTLQQPTKQESTSNIDFELLYNRIVERINEENTKTAARINTLENLLHEVLENQEIAEAKVKTEGCVYTNDSDDSDGEFRVPVVVRLDENDKEIVQKVVDGAVNDIMSKMDKKFEDIMSKIQTSEDLASNRYSNLKGSITESLEDVIWSKDTAEYTEYMVDEVVRRLLENKDRALQDIISKAFKEINEDADEDIKMRLSSIQTKLFGMEKMIMRGM
ncbi:hypothetical protein ABW20_dc0104158 [Dactylellina cionopaga]|nr:hypothetical protein ABW20_dc0104158 [Dactylellina cionopaga]